MCASVKYVYDAFKMHFERITTVSQYKKKHMLKILLSVAWFIYCIGVMLCRFALLSVWCCAVPGSYTPLICVGFAFGFMSKTNACLPQHNSTSPSLIKCIFEWQLANYTRIVDHVLISIFRTGSVGGHLRKNSPRRPQAGPTGLIPRIHTHTHGKVSDGGGS